MAAKLPTVGQLAFRGNVRRAVKKISDGTNTLHNFMIQLPQWPVRILTEREIQTLLGIAFKLNQSLTERVPRPINR